MKTMMMMATTALALAIAVPAIAGETKPKEPPIVRAPHGDWKERPKGYRPPAPRPPTQQQNQGQAQAQAQGQVQQQLQSQDTSARTGDVSNEWKAGAQGGLIALAGLVASPETCLGSASGAVGGGTAALALNFGFGTTTKDADCNARMYARSLTANGQPTAALHVLSNSEQVRAALIATGYVGPLPGGNPNLDALVRQSGSVAPAVLAPLPVEYRNHTRWSNAQNEDEQQWCREASGMIAGTTRFLNRCGVMVNN